MIISILKHMSVPNYLWGEVARHSTYLINRISTRSLVSQTPYEAFKGKKPNVDHLRVFGCLGFAKPAKQKHLRKLDDRSRVLVNLGTEPGSKAYRLMDPTSRKVVVSRDVVFDESRGWKWKTTENEVVEQPGMFKISFGVYGNNGIEREEEVITEEEHRKKKSSQGKQRKQRKTIQNCLYQIQSRYMIY